MAGDDEGKAGRQVRPVARGVLVVRFLVASVGAFFSSCVPV